MRTLLTLRMVRSAMRMRRLGQRWFQAMPCCIAGVGLCLGLLAGAAVVAGQRDLASEEHARLFYDLHRALENGRLEEAEGMARASSLGGSASERTLVVVA